MAQMTMQQEKDISTDVYVIKMYARDLSDAWDNGNILSLHRAAQVLEGVAAHLKSEVESNMTEIRELDEETARKLAEFS